MTHAYFGFKRVAHAIQQIVDSSVVRSFFGAAASATHTLRGRQETLKEMGLRHIFVFALQARTVCEGMPHGNGSGWHPRMRFSDSAYAVPSKYRTREEALTKRPPLDAEMLA